MNKCDIVPLGEATMGEVYSDDKPYYCYTHNASKNEPDVSCALENIIEEAVRIDEEG